MANPNFGKVLAAPVSGIPVAARLGRARLQLGVLRGRAARGVAAACRSTSAISGGGSATEVTDDRALSPADFDTFSIPAPADSRLPDGGGYTWAACAILKTTSFGRAVGQLRDVRGQVRQADSALEWNRPDGERACPRGVMLQGGMSTGRTLTDNCEIVGEAAGAVAVQSRWITAT